MPEPRAKSSSFRELPGRGFADDEIELGYVSGVFGVTGELRLFLFNPRSEALARGADVVLIRPDGSRVGARLKARSGAGKRVLGRIDGVTNPQEAAELMDWRIAIRRADLPETDEDEFYVADLEGLAAICNGREAGRIVSVHETVGGDILEIDTGAPETVFVPAVARYVLDVDVEAGRVLLADDALEEDE